MQKILLVFVAVLLLFFGCSAQPQLSDIKKWALQEEKTKIVISPFSITEENEILMVGAEPPPANNTAISNKTIPDYKFEPDKPLFVFFINTSYGESILIKKGDADILIDAGPLETAVALVNFLREKGVDDIELLVSTHARKENYGGIPTVLDNIEVEQFMWNGFEDDTDYMQVIQQAKEKCNKTIVATYLTQLNINGINFLVINPRNENERFFTTDNDGIVFKITDQNFCLMTTGDIAYGAQAKIANAHDFDPKCKILQIPNYGFGQGTAQIDIFLFRVAPQIAIITGSYLDPANERYTIEEKLKLKSILYYETFNSTSKTTNILRIVSNAQNISVLYS